jgi:hypothetical protein
MSPRPINGPGLGAIRATGRYFDRGNSGTLGKFVTGGKEKFYIRAERRNAAPWNESMSAVVTPLTFETPLTCD